MRSSLAAGKNDALAGCARIWTGSCPAYLRLITDCPRPGRDTRIGRSPCGSGKQWSGLDDFTVGCLVYKRQGFKRNNNGAVSEMRKEQQIGVALGADNTTLSRLGGREAADGT
ncbi:hypothetical protein RRG08_044749 [Elysia crispata]|uniref:Uncharacterized protein n=1 Tax=Elysia crispata TaxID=231223 RepID=A0AAE0ZHL0_9GAST|nr:hypothetical protein RRG08_044749 [Elysia crispata]